MTMVERIDVKRGHIDLISDGATVGWSSYRTGEEWPVATGSSGCRAYAITDANIALIRATGPVGPVRFPALCDWCEAPATWKAVASYTNPYDGSPTTWTTRYCNIHVAGHMASEGPLERLSADACCVVMAPGAGEFWKRMPPSGYISTRRGAAR